MANVILMKLVLGWTCVGIFIALALIFLLSLVNVIKINEPYRSKLFALFAAAIISASIGAFTGMIGVDTSFAENAIKQEAATAINVNLETAVPVNCECGNSETNNPPSSKLIPRVYFHIQHTTQRANAKNAATKLRENNLVVPGIELLDFGPKKTTFKYFRQKESAAAQDAWDLIRNKYQNGKLVYVKGYEKSTKIRDNHFELWVGQ